MDIDPLSAGFDPSRLDRISTHLQANYVSPRKIAGCQVLVWRKGHMAYSRSFGLSDIEKNNPVRDDTIFRIYSMTKPITSLALMMLFEEGRFQLSDPVHRFIPSWKNQRVWVKGEGENMETREPLKPVSVGNLLSHTSGLTYGQNLFPSDHPVDKSYGALRELSQNQADFVESLAKVPLLFDPGTRWCYSLSTDVCGALVEIISGKSFSEFLKERIFDPLEMTDTSFIIDESKVARFAANYGRLENKTLQLIDAPEDSIYADKERFRSGGGGLVSTTADYAKFCEMLVRGGKYAGCRIIGNRTLRMMLKNRLPGGADLASVAVGSFSETAYEGIGFGLGFALTLDEVAANTHGKNDFYWGGMASTIFWIDPGEEMFCIFMTQLVPSGTFNFRGQLKSIVYGALEN
ncbi:MAG: serine hydrolase [Gammaproteobacteria bacterium]|nr:serine hydrolase [Gammaproteobacteria bacterium]